MNKMKFLPFIAALAVAGCANPNDPAQIVDISALSPMSMESDGTAPSVESARVVVYRQFGLEGLLGGIVQAKIRLNEAEIGRCTYGRPIEIDVAPGQYVVNSSSEFPNDKRFDIEAGETAYIVCKLLPGILVPNIGLEIVDAATGKEALAAIIARNQ